MKLTIFLKVCGAILRYYATMKKHCDQFHKGEMTFDEGVSRHEIMNALVILNPKAAITFKENCQMIR